MGLFVYDSNDRQQLRALMRVYPWECSTIFSSTSVSASSSPVFLFTMSTFDDSRIKYSALRFYGICSYLLRLFLLRRNCVRCMYYMSAFSSLLSVIFSYICMDTVYSHRLELSGLNTNFFRLKGQSVITRKYLHKPLQLFYIVVFIIHGFTWALCSQHRLKQELCDQNLSSPTFLKVRPKYLLMVQRSTWRRYTAKRQERRASSAEPSHSPNGTDIISESSTWFPMPKVMPIPRTILHSGFSDSLLS